MRKKLGDLVADILLDVQELGLILAKLKCDKKSDCELCDKVAELASRVVEVLRIQRKVARAK